MRRAFCRGWDGWRLAAGTLALLLASPVASQATPIVFRIFNLGETTAYIVQRNSRTVGTEATSSDGVFAQNVDAIAGDQIVLAPNTDLAPPVPPAFTSVSAQGQTCAHLTWTPSGDPSVIGYKISYGTLSVASAQLADYQYSFEVGAISSYDVCSLAGTTYYFAVQAINFAGQESAYSEERSIQLVTTAVLISRFDARAQGDGVRLSWDVVTDENIAGYFVYRRMAGGDERRILDTPLAAGTDSYLDTDVQSGTRYTYVLAAIRDDSSEIRSAPASATTPSIALALEPNAPNPFRTTTRIPFSLDAASSVTIRVYDVTGALVTTLFNGPLSEGSHDVNWNGMDGTGRRVASGTYFCALTAGKRMQSRKMLLVR
jgi:fibronectin type 3 domain-containing protein